MVSVSRELMPWEFLRAFFDLIHDGGVVPLSLPCDSLRKVRSLGLANFLVTYQCTQWIHIPFWAFDKHPSESTKLRLRSGEVP